MGLFNNKPKADTGYSNNYQITENGDDTMPIRIDLADDDDYYYIYADVPGKKINDIKIKFKGKNFSIRVIEESDAVNPISNKSCIIQERLHDEFERIIEFDDPVDKKKVDARLENGLLMVTIKKLDPELEDEEDLIQIKS